MLEVEEKVNASECMDTNKERNCKGVMRDTTVQTNEAQQFIKSRENTKQSKRIK
jgi:hypothetical protein